MNLSRLIKLAFLRHATIYIMLSKVLLNESSQNSQHICDIWCIFFFLFKRVRNGDPERQSGFPKSPHVRYHQNLLPPSPLLFTPHWATSCAFTSLSLSSTIIKTTTILLCEVSMLPVLSHLILKITYGQKLFLSLFYRWENWGLERLETCPSQSPYS